MWTKKSNKLALSVSTLVTLVTLVACDVDSARIKEPPPPEDQQLAGVNTNGPLTVTVGEQFSVFCEPLAEDGQVMTNPPSDIEEEISFELSDLVQSESFGLYKIDQVGTYTATCSYPSLEFTDTTPHEFTVVTGVPVKIVTTLSTDSAVAGEEVAATCTVYDAANNVLGSRTGEGLTDDPTFLSDLMLTITPDNGNAGASLRQEDLTIHETLVDTYEVRCTLPTDEGASLVLEPAAFDVIPAGVCSIALSISPPAPEGVHLIGQELTISHTAQDIFGNPVDLDSVFLLSYTYTGSSTAVPLNTGAGSIVINSTITYSNAPANGTGYVIRGLTDSGDPDCGVESFVYSDVFPEIVDTDPSEIGCPHAEAHGQNWNSFSGTVDLDVTSVTVQVNDGVSKPASLNTAEGKYEIANLELDYGINRLNVEATDTGNNTAKRTCTVLIADHWIPEGILSSGGGKEDVITMFLGPNAIHDGAPYDPVTSIGDLTHRSLEQFYAKILADFEEMIDFLINVGILASGADVLTDEYQVSRPFQGGASLEEGHLALFWELDDDANVSWPYDSFVLKADLDVRNPLKKFIANFTVDNPSGSVELSPALKSTGIGFVDTTTLNYGIASEQQGGAPCGNSGPLYEQTCALWPLFPLVFTDTPASTLPTSLQEYTNQWFKDTVQLTLENVHVPPVFSNAYKENLDGVDPGFQFSPWTSSFDVNESRLRVGLGLGARVNVTQQVYSMPGTPSRGDTAIDPSVGTSRFVYGFDEDALGVGMFALWRGGFFKAADLGIANGPLANLVSAQNISVKNLDTFLPPVVTVENNGKLRVQLGAVRAEVTHPGITQSGNGGAVWLNLAGDVSADISMDINGVSISNILMGADDLYIGTKAETAGITINGAARAFLRSLMAQMVERALKRVVGSMRLPLMKVPNSLPPGMEALEGIRFAPAAVTSATIPRGVIGRGN